jgi:ABC-type uncharacterized transport system permease subunit
MAALKGAPLEAKPDQNHDAHIIVHGKFMEDPAYQSPSVQQLLIAHIQEHLALKYQIEMAQMVQDPQAQQAIMAPPQQQQQMQPQMQNQIALMAANAADKVLKLDEEKAKIMAGETEDPQQEQVEIQKQDLALRAKKQLDIMRMHKDKMDLEESKVIIDDENKDEDRKLKEEQLAVKATNDAMKDAEKLIYATKMK